MIVTINRKAHFNAAHRLHVEQWSEEKNKKIFGKCNNPNYHGHNYELTVSITGEIDPVTGILIDLRTLKTIVKQEVEDSFDHKNLNEEIPEFQKLNPTVENISIVIWQKLRKRINPKHGLEITLYETPRNFATYSGK